MTDVMPGTDEPAAHQPKAMGPGEPPPLPGGIEAALVDGRQSERALAIARGTRRMLLMRGLTSMTEFTLASGRRADIIALTPSGEVWVIEVKSSVADFRSDLKWPEYEAFADRLYFAVAPDFPTDILPETTGLILADAFGADIMREAPALKLAPARRKALTLQLARIAAQRLHQLQDPAFVPPSRE